MAGDHLVMEMDPYHRRLIEAGLDICQEYGLFLAGGYAMKAHGLVDRPSNDVDFATSNPLPLDVIGRAVADAYRAQGFGVQVGDGNDTYVRLMVSSPGSGEACELDLMKVPLRVRPVLIGRCPVVGFEDAIGLKMRALNGRGVARDLIDVAAMAGDYGYERLEWLGRTHDPEFSLDRLVFRLGNFEFMDPEEFEQYGLGEAEIRRVRRFAVEWAQDIDLRLMGDGKLEDL